ncbi:MAG: BPTD_3080 family restriction endonuclease [Betaproteobacteria bacterium]|jgi:type III restriction enzyme
MSSFEVATPILNSPFEEPKEHWWIVEGQDAERREGRRFAHYFYRDPRSGGKGGVESDTGTMIELKLVSRIRTQMLAWRELALRGEGGVTRTTHELLNYWSREGRQTPLFFAQREAAEAVIFLTEARADFLQGINVPRDEPSDEAKADGYAGFLRYCCKMATGSGKSTVMGMLAAWSILNKQSDRSDARFSDVVLVVCPNVTIRDRLAELDPSRGEASLYRTRDLVPPHLMSSLMQGHVLITNWHAFEAQSPNAGGVSAKVLKAGVREQRIETITIGDKTTTARGTRYLTLPDFRRQVDAGLLRAIEEIHDKDGELAKVRVETNRYRESDTALIERVLGREIGGKRNILVLNDEAHHAYRIRRDEADEFEQDLFGEDEEAEEFFKEATVWIEGLDKVQKVRGINVCVDFSATPYFLGRVGQQAGRPFPWIVSDFGLIDAIESGLTKIPQLAVRDASGAAIPGYFNIWEWIKPQLTASERGGKKAAPKPEAILKYANVPIAMLAGLWEQEFRLQESRGAEARLPVFILVCKNTKIASVIFDWLANNKAPHGIPASPFALFRNGPDDIVTIRVDSKVVQETDSGAAKEDESRWMRFTLDTVGRRDWPRDGQLRAVYPPGFVELAQKLDRPLHPPGRDIRCIVSVGMLTEGWDCNTVTHIVGLRPFMSQLLCEQVVGRGLRRMHYDLGADGKFSEETAKIFGVPFQVIPFKANPTGVAVEPPVRTHVHALPSRAEKFAIRFPRVEGYTQSIRSKIVVHWDEVPDLKFNAYKIPPEVEMKRLSVTNRGRPALTGPGVSELVDLTAYRRERRLQELEFEMARSITLDLIESRRCEIPVHTLFPQVLAASQRYVAHHVQISPPHDKRDAFLSPYYGWMVEKLSEAIRPDTVGGDAPEVPRYESRRGAGSTGDVSFWTSRPVREVLKSHVNYVVADTDKWEQSAAYYLDRHPRTRSFVKNAGLGFAIPYLYNGEQHDYVPDFVVRLTDEDERYVVLETKGYDPLEDVKRAAAERWMKAVNADGRYGIWRYAVSRDPHQIPKLIESFT